MNQNIDRQPSYSPLTLDTQNYERKRPASDSTILGMESPPNKLSRTGVDAVVSRPVQSANELRGTADISSRLGISHTRYESQPDPIAESFNPMEFNQAVHQIAAAHWHQVGRMSQRIRDLQTQLQASEERAQRAADVLQIKSSPSHQTSAQRHVGLEAVLAAKDDSFEAYKKKTLQDIDKLKERAVEIKTEVPQEDISKQWMMLSNEIENLVRYQLSGEPLSQVRSSAQKSFWGILHTDWQKGYVRSHEQKRYIMEAAIWHMLVDCLLSQPMVVFQWRLGAAMTMIQTKILGYSWAIKAQPGVGQDIQGPDITHVPEREMKQYHLWRILTSQMASDHYDPSEFCNSQSEHTMYDSLFDNLERTLHEHASSKGRDDSLKTALESIIKHAVQLCSMIVRSQDHYVVSMPTVYAFHKMPPSREIADVKLSDFNMKQFRKLKYSSLTVEDRETMDWIIEMRHNGFLYDNDLMTDMRGAGSGSTDTVDLVMSPMFLRYSENNCAYTKAEVMAKSRVLCITRLLRKRG